MKVIVRYSVFQWRSENYLLNSLKLVGEVSVDHHDIVLFNYAIGGSMMNNISLCCFKTSRYRPCEKDVLEYLN